MFGVICEEVVKGEIVFLGNGVVVVMGTLCVANVNRGAVSLGLYTNRKYALSKNGSLVGGNMVVCWP